MPDQISYREVEWNTFAELVRQHVAEYTVPQYGDYPEDQLTDFTVHDCMLQIKRYANRAGRNSRHNVDEETRDCIKIAHYACAAFAKLAKEQLDEDNCCEVQETQEQQVGVSSPD